MARQTLGWISVSCEMFFINLLAPRRNKEERLEGDRGVADSHRYHSSSFFDSNFTIFLELLLESENNKKKKKNITFKFFVKKSNKEKKKKFKIKNRVHIAINNISDSSDSQFIYTAYKALFESDSNSNSNIKEKKVIAYIAAIEKEFLIIRDLLIKTRV